MGTSDEITAIITVDLMAAKHAMRLAHDWAQVAEVASQNEAANTAETAAVVSQWFIRQAALILTDGQDMDTTEILSISPLRSHIKEKPEHYMIDAIASSYNCV